MAGTLKDSNLIAGRLLTGVSPLIQHNGAGRLDTRSPASVEIAEITAKRGGNRTSVDDCRLRELECGRALYLDADGKPAIPEAAVRSVIEASGQSAAGSTAGSPWTR